MKGGTGAPDLYYCYVAAVLTRLENWFHYSDTKHWVLIEQWLNQFDLKALPWLDLSTSDTHRDLSLTLPSLTSHLLNIWVKTALQLELSSHIGHPYSVILVSRQH